HSLLATRLLNKLRKSYEKAELSLRSFFENATVAGVVHLIEKSYGTESKDGLLQKFFSRDSSVERRSLVQGYLMEKLAQIFEISVEEISVKENLIDRGLEAVISDLIFEIKRDFGLRTYPHELLNNSSIEKLADFIATEVDRMNRLQEIFAGAVPPIDNGQSKKLPKKQASQKSVKKNKTMIFLLSAPRSGSVPPCCGSCCLAIRAFSALPSYPC
ncbi:acyl carrier protein, partial [candidate division KSB1 bacterium]|nr:acyl carrier protein [candidate division KSB1 bacterium]NIS25214.1 acyl carrier protein [candidate division KSB1 bacterium]NIT72122.1 acyl carrier protein [candidate division KSB1 bacterium]NIU28676.1 acyl carrier protein [candidate division KSB1 bacterium]NIU94433.1 hypothetical protein [candidate division KSB1 bacterium]